MLWIFVMKSRDTHDHQFFLKQIFEIFLNTVFRLEFCFLFNQTEPSFQKFGFGSTKFYFQNQVFASGLAKFKFENFVSGSG